ncbi:MAG: VgrG-related protein [Acidimicrobiales bacterium]
MPGMAFAKIEINGTPLPDETMGYLDAVVVENSLNLPDTFSARFVDQEGALIPTFARSLGAPVTISVMHEGESAPVKIMQGELTAVEVEFDETGTRTIARGMDVAYRLQGARKTKAWPQATASDVARRIAGSNGLAAGTVDATTTVYEHLVQANMTDLEFLRRLGAENDRLVVVTEGKLHFRKQPQASSAPSPGRLTTPDPLKLVLHGDHVKSLRATIRSAGQVKEVRVRGWDPQTKQVVVGTAQAGTSAASSGTGPAKLAARAGNAVHTSVTTPFGKHSEAAAAAKDLADHLGSTFAEIEGSIEGHPRLTAGETVSISNFGAPLDGKFKVSNVTHRIDARGYETSFLVCGQQDRSLMGLVAGGLGAGDDGRIPGVVSGIVTDVKDPEAQGRVKVKFPWMSDDYGTSWCRMVQFGAGQDRGALFLPEVNDEVLVAFEQGDPRRPYVLGGLYNGQDKPKAGGPITTSNGKVARRGYVSKTGSMLVFFEEPGKEGIAILSSDKGLRISLNKTKTTIHVASNGEIKIEGRSKVTVDGGQELVLTARKVSIGASDTTSVEVKGVQIDVKASAKASVSAPQVSLG